jgi:hypothetical protein
MMISDPGIEQKKNHRDRGWQDSYGSLWLVAD